MHWEAVLVPRAAADTEVLAADAALEEELEGWTDSVFFVSSNLRQVSWIARLVALESFFHSDPGIDGGLGPRAAVC